MITTNLQPSSLSSASSAKGRRSRRYSLAGLVLAAFAAAALSAIVGPSEPANAQGCFDPLGQPIPCPTEPPTCGLPGLPACPGGGDDDDDAPTKTPRPRPTSTPTPTPSHTATPTCDVTTGIGCPSPTHSSTPTITLVPTHTPIPTPTKLPPSPLVELITTFVGKLFPDPESMAPVPAWMQPPNLEVTALEITQVIQCMHNLQCSDNSVPLFSGKLTMVRAYVRVKSPPNGYASGIGGALCFGDTGSAGCENPIRPLYKIQVWQDPDPMRYARPQLVYTLDFILPSYFVTGGATKTITVYANYNFENYPKETYYKDNHRVLQYQVQASEPINIRYHYVQNQLAWPNMGRIWDVYDFLDETFPTSQINLVQGVPLLFKDYEWLTPSPRGCTKGWMDLLDDMSWMRNGSGPIPLGLVPSATLKGGASGCGYIGVYSAATADGNGAGRTAAQEIGHNLNRSHAPGCGAGGPDPNFPGLNGGLDEVGTDVLHRKLYQPYWVYDYMGYCGGMSNTWTSIYTYEAMAGLLPAGAYHTPPLHMAAPLRAGELVLVGSGDVSPSQAVLQHGFYRLDGAGMQLSPEGGLYALDLLDASGSVLASHTFAPLYMSDGEPSASGPFRLLIPWVEGVTSLVFRYKDQEIGRVDASRNAPEVGLVAPAGGQAWEASGLQTLAWIGTDADNDPLQYFLQYSTDGGLTWSALAPNLSETTFEIDTAWLPGSDDARLRLIASDGLNTTQVDSVPIRVTGKPPEAHISGPTIEDEVISGSTAVLQGAAIDLEDGFLGDDNLSWASDRDGVLGTGRTAILPSLTEGQHTLTLTAVDSDGNAATESVDVIVQPAPLVEPARAPSLLPCLAGVIVIGVGALVVAFAIGRRSRRVQKPKEA